MNKNEDIKPKCIFEQDEKFNNHFNVKYTMADFIKEQIDINLAQGIGQVIKESVNELVDEELKNILKGELKNFIAKSINEAIKNQFSSLTPMKTLSDKMNFNHKIPVNMVHNPTADGLKDVSRSKGYRPANIPPDKI